MSDPKRRMCGRLGPRPNSCSVITGNATLCNTTTSLNIADFSQSKKKYLIRKKVYLSEHKLNEKLFEHNGLTVDVFCFN